MGKKGHKEGDPAKRQSAIINAYAKFAGDNSAMERAAKARERASWLKSLLAELEAE